MYEPLHIVLVENTYTMRYSWKILQLTKTLGPFIDTMMPCHLGYNDVKIGSFLGKMFRYSYNLLIT